jgi:hypothetical protein
MPTQERKYSPQIRTTTRYFNMARMNLGPDGENGIRSRNETTRKALVIP